MVQKFLDKAFLESKGRKGIVRNQQRRIGRRERERERRGKKFREREREERESACVSLCVDVKSNFMTRYALIRISKDCSSKRSTFS